MTEVVIADSGSVLLVHSHVPPCIMTSGQQNKEKHQGNSSDLNFNPKQTNKIYFRDMSFYQTLAG